MTSCLNSEASTRFGSDEDNRSELQRTGIGKTKLYEITTFIGLKIFSNYVNDVGTEHSDTQESGRSSEKWTGERLSALICQQNRNLGVQDGLTSR